MKGLLRRLLGLPSRGLSRGEVLDIARRECASRGWSFDEPVRVHGGIRRYVVWTRSDWKGGNAVIVIDARDGRVLEATVTPG